MTLQRRLIDLFDLAEITAPPNHLAVQTMTIGRDARLAIFHHPASESRFPGLVVGPRARLQFSYGIKSATRERVCSPVVAGKTINLIFRTLVPQRGLPDFAWAGWGDPMLVSEMVESTSSVPRTGKSRAGHVLLITPDALRADRLGCYGNTQVQTPNLDRLANDGLRWP